METILTPQGLMAVATVVAGVVLFALAEVLPSPLGPAFSRFVGLGVVWAMMAPLYALAESWLPPSIVVGAGTLGIVVIHLIQSRTSPQDEIDTPEPAADEPPAASNANEN